MSRPSSSNNSVYLRGWGTGYLGMWVGVCCGGGGTPMCSQPCPRHLSKEFQHLQIHCFPKSS